MNQSLYDLYMRQMITGEDAFAHCNEPEELRNMIEGRAIVRPRGGAS